MTKTQVHDYIRKGKIVKRYEQARQKHRGRIMKIHPQLVFKTHWTVDNTTGLFTGRESVLARHDATGVRRDWKGRIIGRTKSIVTKG